MIKNKIIIFLLVLFVNSSIFSGINKKNGNFYISYNDVSWTSDKGIKYDLIRTYNSKSTGNGLFGYGWNSIIETRLFEKNDGSVVIYHYGSGAQEEFRSTQKTEKQNDISNDILSVIEPLDDEYVIEELLSVLHKDNEVLDKYLEYMSKYNLGKSLTINNDDILWGDGMSFVVKSETGFIFMNVDRDILFFDLKGKLVRINNFGGTDYLISYNIDNLISFISLADENGWVFDYENGVLSSITDILNSKQSTYIIKDKKLLQNNNMDNGIFKYEYDKNYNMTKITYGDDSKLQLFYGEKTQFAEKLIDRNGDIIEYYYYGNDYDYGVEITKTTKDAVSFENWRYVTELDQYGYSYVKLLQVTLGEKTIGTEKNASGQITGLLLGKREERLDFIYYKNRELKEITGKNIKIDFKYNDNGLEKLNYRFLDSYNSLNFDFTNNGYIKEIKSTSGDIFKTKFRSEGLLDEVSIIIPGKYTIIYNYDNAGELESIYNNGLLVKDMKSFLNETESIIWETFFEFYQFYRSKVKVFMLGQLECGECHFGFYSQHGKISKLAKE